LHLLLFDHPSGDQRIHAGLKPTPSRCAGLIDSEHRARRRVVSSGQLRRSPEQRAPSARKGAQQAEMICPATIWTCCALPAVAHAFAIARV
jgi:hypothetical protein